MIDYTDPWFYCLLVIFLIAGWSLGIFSVIIIDESPIPSFLKSKTAEINHELRHCHNCGHVRVTTRPRRRSNKNRKNNDQSPQEKAFTQQWAQQAKQNSGMVRESPQETV